ncbi:MAG: hypothetical protein ACLQVD_19110 [Capsulimonadaceae bacterium]
MSFLGSNKRQPDGHIQLAPELASKVDTVLDLINKTNTNAIRWTPVRKYGRSYRTFAAVDQDGTELKLFVNPYAKQPLSVRSSDSITLATKSGTERKRISDIAALSGLASVIERQVG